jgi:deazaflavin-dependent oxidoreductase (nitroreductase family)
MRKCFLLGAVVGAAAGLYLYRRSQLPIERRDLLLRRTMNERLTPILVRHGAADGERTGLGVIEHVGRISGKLRRTLVHPIPVGDRFAIPLAYGEKGQWPQNVLAAGRCRLQYHDSVYDLANPRAVDGAAIEGLPAVDERIARAVGGRYLLLDVESVAPGRLEGASKAGANDELAPA